MTRVFRKEGRGRFGHRDRDKQKRRSYAMEAESGVMELQVKGHGELAETNRSWKRQRRILPWSLRTAWPADTWISDFQSQKCLLF